MQIIPAIDLKDNKCVRLSKGVDESSEIFNTNAVEQAIFFQNSGCKKIHIVDLDAAFGRVDINLQTIKKIRQSISIPIQLGGGIRSELDIKKYFDLGINNLILGSMAVSHPDIVKQISKQYKKRIYISLDVKGNSIMIKGWKKKSNLGIKDILEFYKTSNIKGYIVTDIENDGMLNGINISFLQNILSMIKNTQNYEKNVIMAGGLTNYNDLIKLIEINSNELEGVVAGKSFYVGNIELNKAQNIIKSYGKS